MDSFKDGNAVVAAELKDNILDPVDDALELDAPDSDVENADASIVTVISASDNKPSPPKSCPNGLPESIEQSVSKSPDVTCKSTGITSQSSERRKNTSVSAGQDGERPTARRRQWGSQSRTTSGLPSISTDSLEKLVPTLTTESGTDPTRPATVNLPDIKATEAENGHVELEVEAIVEHIDQEEVYGRAAESKVVQSTKPTSKDGASSHTKVAPSKRETQGTASKNSSPEEERSTKVPSPHKKKGPKETKAVGYLVEAPERVEPSQPAKHKATTIVYIRSLVRPFTAEQLRQMISDHYGPVDELWLDRIKSSSLVRMTTMEGAERCREGLDGSRWPSMNPRVLRCDFGNEELFTWMKANGASGDVAPPRYLVLGQSEDTMEDRPIKEGSRSDRTTKREIGAPDSRKRANPSTREKAASPRPKSPDQKEVPEAKKKRDEPAKLLDDLFRKTSSAPCIYWLPLTEDEAKKQAEERIRVFAAKRSAYGRTVRPTQRATRSPFTSPGPNDATTKKSTEPTNHSASMTKPPQSDRSAVPAASKEVPTKESASESKSKTRDDTGDRNRKKSPVSRTSDLPSEKREKRPQESRKREQSPFTPVKTHSSTEAPATKEKSNRLTTSSSSTTKRPHSRTPSPPRSQPSKSDRRRRLSSSRSSTDRGDSKRRTTGSSTRRDRRSPPSSSKYTRTRSRSVERRAISPPTHRSYGRSQR